MTTRTVGPTTLHATGGFTIGTAAALIIVWLLGQAGIDATPIQEALGFLIQAAGVILGGWSAPPTQPATDNTEEEETND